MFSEEEIRAIIGESGSDMSNEIDFEGFLRVSLMDLFLQNIYVKFYICVY